MQTQSEGSVHAAPFSLQPWLQTMVLEFAGQAIQLAALEPRYWPASHSVHASEPLVIKPENPGVQTQSFTSIVPAAELVECVGQLSQSCGPASVLYCPMAQMVQVGITPEYPGAHSQSLCAVHPVPSPPEQPAVLDCAGHAVHASVPSALL